jgi:hypothetical protein
MAAQPQWPNDADGDVLRGMEECGFDFSSAAIIDFNVDFEPWPPQPAALVVLRARFRGAEVIEPEGDFRGYVQFQVEAPVTYELVIRMQREVTDLMRPYGGYCESWGVMQE